MFDVDAGAGLRSDKQIRTELRGTVDQVLRACGASASANRIEIRVTNGKAYLSGDLPDRGSRRLVLLAASAIPSVMHVDSSALRPTSRLD
jgi:osmotically-inducible protein OsmY